MKNSFPALINEVKLSAVGHIVGLGDRHVQNILIDKATSELIHIDLGVAFDQVQFLTSLLDRLRLRLL